MIASRLRTLPMARSSLAICYLLYCWVAGSQISRMARACRSHIFFFTNLCNSRYPKQHHWEFIEATMQSACRSWLTPYLHQRSLCRSRPTIQQFLVHFQRSKHSLAPSGPFRPLAFYALHALPETSLPSLESNIRNQLKKLDTVGRIYLAPDTGIGGINAQLSVPVHQVSAVQSVFDTLSHFKGISFEYNYGMKDTERPSFRTLKVLRKPHVCWLLLHAMYLWTLALYFMQLNSSLCQQLVAVGSSVNSRDLSKKPIYLTPDQWHQQLSDCDKDTLLIDMRNHYEQWVYFNRMCTL